MSQISGVYTPGIETIPITGVATIVRTAHNVSGGNMPVCVVIADLSGDIDSTLTINRGTWNGAVFTPDATSPRLGFISAPAGMTIPETILYVAKASEAFQFITTGGASTKAHIRIDGHTEQVSP